MNHQQKYVDHRDSTCTAQLDIRKTKYSDRVIPLVPNHGLLHTLQP